MAVVFPMVMVVRESLGMVMLVKLAVDVCLAFAAAAGRAHDVILQDSILRQGAAEPPDYLSADAPSRAPAVFLGCFLV